jgi:tetratricopeptide (TPR) repeat protein
MKTIKFFISLLVCWTGLCSIGHCFEVSAQVDKTKISSEESIILVIEVRGGKAEPDLSVVRDFKVSSRGTSSSFRFINGKSERSSSYRFLLTPLSKGELSIPSIPVTGDGKTVRTEPVTIKVAAAKTTSEESQNLFARAELSRARIYPGEAVVYNLRFFSSRQLSGLAFESTPDFKGIPANQVGKERSYTKTINGVLFQITELNYLLQPANPGTYKAKTYKLDPIVLIAQLIVKSRPGSGFDSFFDDSFFSRRQTKPVRVSSNPLSLKVLPLPRYSGSDKFSGLVGSFDIEATLDKQEIIVGDSATLTIKISGSGNIMDAGAPDLDMAPYKLEPETFKIYDDTPVESIKITSQGYQGHKIFKKALVPVNPGKYKLPGLSLVYFDVKEKAYKILKTPEIPLNVLPGAKIYMTENQTKIPQVTQKEVVLMSRDILDIKEGLDVLRPQKELSMTWFLMFMGFPALLFSGLSFYVRIGKKEDSIEKSMQEKVKRILKQAEKISPEDKAFSNRLYSALVSAILSTAGRKGETLTLGEAKSILTEAGTDPDKIKNILELLEKIESACFSGRKIDTAEGKSLLKNVRKAIKMLIIILACTLFFAFSSEKLMADELSYVEGVRHYKAGQFSKAASIFENLALSGVKNAFLYYNTGNAFLKADDLGRAILWYERAKVIMPNDPDLNYNLSYAQSLLKDKTDKTEDSVDIMGILFFWDKLFSVTAIRITTIAFSFIFFTWASVRVLKRQKIFSGTGIALFAALIFVILLVTAQHYTHHHRINAVVLDREITVRSGMSDDSTELFRLHAGTKVKVEDKHGEYLKIRFSRDRIGWVEAGKAEIINY